MREYFEKVDTDPRQLEINFETGVRQHLAVNHQPSLRIEQPRTQTCRSDILCNCVHPSEQTSLLLLLQELREITQLFLHGQ